MIKRRHLVFDAADYCHAARYFLKGLGFVYLMAFVSLWTQVDGLIGRDGILPAADFLQRVKEQYGTSAYWNLPTLCWFNSSDVFLHVLCALGVLFSCVLMVGAIPSWACFVLWALYLSLTTVSQIFLGYQWDNLLLESGFLAILLAGFLSICSGASVKRRSLRITDAQLHPPKLIVFLFQWFLFRLMFSSGFVKLASGDDAWRNLSALNYHFWTQPLPTWVAWFIDKMPASVDKVSTLIMFLMELVLPFFIFAPRRLRYIACWGLASLQIFIGVTGNYCFFNILSVLMCLFLLDDAWFEKRMDCWAVDKTALRRSAATWCSLPVFVVIIFISLMTFCSTLRLAIPWPRPLIALYRAADPFRSINGYGLFAVMTKTRPEIIIEGSNDGKTWQAYEFKWKPGDLKHRPGFVAPHQPRLDWQMWFAALGNVRGNPWFVNFLVRLLEGEPNVLALLKNNPFPEKPPNFIRASVYDYTFTSFSEWKKTGAWWNCVYKGLYSPPIQLPSSSGSE